MAAPITALKPDGPTTVARSAPLRGEARRRSPRRDVKRGQGFARLRRGALAGRTVGRGVWTVSPGLWILDFPAKPAPTAAAERSRRVRGSSHDVVTFFACGELADRLSKTPKERDRERRARSTRSDVRRERRVAVAREVVASHVADWSAVETAGGAYTYPTLHAAGSRGPAAPERDAVFFAGEATHVGVNPHAGGDETGTRAADEV